MPSTNASAGRWRQVAAQQVAQQPRDARLARRSRWPCRRRRSTTAITTSCTTRLHQHEALRRTHAFHERHGIEVATRVALRRHRDRDRREQHAHQAGSERKRPARSAEARICGLASAIDCTRSPRALRASSHSRNSSIGPGSPGKQHCSTHAAARLHQLRGRQVRAIDHQRGGQVGEAAALVGAIVEHARDADLCGAHGQRRAHRRAQFRQQA